MLIEALAANLKAFAAHDKDLKILQHLLLETVEQAYQQAGPESQHSNEHPNS
jgi:hypothetical protein